MNNVFIHPTSFVNEKSTIGDNTKIWQYCVIMDGVSIGEYCNIGQGVFIEKDVQVGNNVKIKNGISIYTGVEIEDDVFLGPNCVFTNVINPRSFIERKNDFRKTMVKKGASIGANATIVCGNTIGSYALIGAGCVVTKDVPDYALMVGNPAKIQGYVCKCGEKLREDSNELLCSHCKKTYVFNKNGELVEKQDGDC